MSIAFLIHTHKSLEQISRLCSTVERGLAKKHVTISHNGSAEDRARLASFRGVDRVIPAIGGRAQFGLIDAFLGELRRLERESSRYEWIVVLSGQDYPIRPLAELAAELDQSTFDGYLHHFDTTKPRNLPPETIDWPDHEVETRYYFQHTLLKRASPPALRAAVTLPRRLLNRSRDFRLHTGFGLTFGRRAPNPPFTPDFRLHGGNAWMTIRRTAAQSILRFVDDRPDITNYFRRVLTPDEAFLQTIMANDPTLRLSARELRYFDCTAAFLGQMKTLGPADLPRAFASNCYFARKFDIDRDPYILDTIDAHLANISSVAVPAGRREAEVVPPADRMRGASQGQL
jgi:hypothetical protein